MRDVGPVLVLAPHPDDEVLGAGGTIARFSDEGREVCVAVVTAGRPPAFPPAYVAQVRAEAAAAHRDLGVHQTFWLDQPAAGLADGSHSVLNGVIQDVVRRVQPTLLLVPFLTDIHRDHREVFESALVAARPHQAEYPHGVWAYETLSETNWNAPYLTAAFQPNLFVDIAATLERKGTAMARFASQLRDAPHERSLSSLRALATLRGSTVHLLAAEAFVIIRQVV